MVLAMEGVRASNEQRRKGRHPMADVLAVVALLGIPLAIFIAVSWRQEERDRDEQGEHRRPGNDSYWGGMGRPGR